MHYNENAQLPQTTTKQGEAVFKIAFPKSKQGECTAKPVKTDPTFNYVDDLMSLLLHKVIVDPTPYVEELHQITIPPPCHQSLKNPARKMSLPAMCLGLVKGWPKSNVLSSWIRKLLAYPANYTRRDDDPHMPS